MEVAIKNLKWWLLISFTCMILSFILRQNLPSAKDFQQLGRHNNKGVITAPCESSGLKLVRIDHN